MYQPYIPYPQIQPMQQQPMMSAQTSAPSISGRIVKAVDEIMPNEVPMNGSVGFFPLSDMSSIFVKCWNQDGTISTVKYEPIKNSTEPEEQPVSLIDIMDSLNDIQDLLKAEKPATTQKRSSATARKKADNDSE